MDLGTTKTRLCDFYGCHGLKEVELAIIAYHKENRIHTEFLLPRFWTAGYFILVFQSRVYDYYDKAKAYTN